LRLGTTDGSSSKGDIKVRVRNISTNHCWTLDKSVVRNFVGYVPQEDIFDRDLTVRELFTFNALTRLQGKRTSAEIKVIVDEALAELSMQHVADSIIGGGENKAANISGGQLKRVNIGCELVSLQRPGILLLDEPTNGLDASVAFELMETLEVVRDRGITIVMVIQQPRAEIFAKIEHLFLMNSCGGIVYEGTSGGAVPYLTSIGYNIAEETSDADFCVDVLNGLNDTYNEYGSMKVLDSKHLHHMWRSSTPSAKVKKSLATMESGEVEVIDTLSSVKYDIPLESKSSMLIKTIGRMSYLTYLNAMRLLRVRLRDQNALILYAIINIIMAIALSSGFSILITGSYLSIFRPPTANQFYPFNPEVLGVLNERAASFTGFTQLLFFISSALGTASCLVSVPVFAGKAAIFAREKTGGMPVIAFGVGRMIADLFFVTLNAFVFAGIW
jgi:ABC-type multidrug transport system ATPase subunit